MYVSLKVSRRLLAVAISACSLLAFSAASASASEIPASWVGVTTPTEANMSGSVTIKRNGANAKTCTISTGKASSGTIWNTAGQGFGDIYEGLDPSNWEYVFGSCTGGTTFGIYARLLTPIYNTSTSTYFIEMGGVGGGAGEPPSGYTAPGTPRYLWGAPTELKPKLVNGSGIVFNNTVVGTDFNSGTITVTGTVSVKRGAVSATLTH
jgi:hypothetical protein